MTGPDRPARIRLWRRGDCIALAALLGAWGLVLARLGLGSISLGQPVRLDPARVALVAETVDPNTATAASLRRLPLIGPVKAEAIVRYRRQARDRGDLPAFRYCEDLLRVPGIGPATIERAGKRLALPNGPSPATQP